MFKKNDGRGWVEVCTEKAHMPKKGTSTTNLELTKCLLASIFSPGPFSGAPTICAKHGTSTRVWSGFLPVDCLPQEVQISRFWMFS